MIISLRRWLRALKFLLLFAVLLTLSVHVYRLLNAWIEPDGNPQLPPDGALKVSGTASSQPQPLLEQLKQFYWYGE